LGLVLVDVTLNNIHSFENVKGEKEKKTISTTDEFFFCWLVCGLLVWLCELMMCIVDGMNKKAVKR